MRSVHGKVKFVNRRARDYFGVSQNDPLSGYRLFEDPSISDDTKWKVKHNQEAIENRYIDFHTIKNHKMYKSIKSEEDQLFIRLKYKPFETSSTKSSGLIVIIQDLTELKKIEEKLIESENLLNISQSMSKAGGWEWNVGKQTMKWTEETYRLHDMNHLDFTEGSTLHIEKSMNCYRPEDRVKINTAFTKCLDNGEPYDLELPFKTAKGRNIWIRTTAKAEMKNGSVTKITGIIIDITERKKIEEQLAQSQKMDSIGQLAGGIAHNFNNVLSVIMNATQLLQTSNINLDERSLKFTNMILTASERASDLISKLLTFSRKNRVSLSLRDLDKILKETVDLLWGTLDKKINISMTTNAVHTCILGDNSGLENIFLNLCLNASQAMEDGGKIHIQTDNTFLDKPYCDSSVFELTPGEFCRISVCDTGTGISSENLNRIFDPFFTTKEQGKGTGLGLSAVYGIIQEHYGEILVESELGKGTSFTVLLPCSLETIVEAEENTFAQKGLGTILFTDDEEFNRILGKEILENLGYTVLLAENGLKSIEIFKLKHREIDIVIMDMIMPELDGYKAFLEMKKIDPECNIIIASGHTKDEKIRELNNAGLKGFLQKPYTISEISELLNEILSK